MTWLPLRTGWGDLTSMAPSGETRKVPYLPNVEVGNTITMVESCADRLPILVLRRTRRVSTHTSLNRNTLHVLNVKIGL